MSFQKCIFCIFEASRAYFGEKCILVHISAIFQLFFFVNLLNFASLHGADRGTSENIRLL
jgi:hypothetical protein